MNKGKQLAEVPKAQCSATARTIITPTSGYTPNTGDWVLIDEGFCNDGLGIGYDRMYISLFENDPSSAFMNRAWLFNLPTELSILYEGHHHMEMTAESDIFLRQEIRPSDFSTSTSSLYLDGYLGVWSLSLNEPPVNHSWIKLELF